MISMSLIFLLFLGLGTYGLSTLYYWKEKNRQKAICVKKALSQQAQVTEHINELLMLNKKSVALHTKYKKAKLKLLAAVASQNPVAIRLAQKLVARYKTLLLALDKAQKALISSLNLTLQKWRLRKNSKGPIKARLNRKPKVGIAPQYRVAPNALKNFALGQRGKVQRRRNLTFTKDWNWHCGASIEKWRNQWKPRLIEAKFLWNSSYSYSF